MGDVPMQYGLQGHQGGSPTATQDEQLRAVSEFLCAQAGLEAGGSIDADGNKPAFGSLLKLLDGFDCPQTSAEFKAAYTSTLRRSKLANPKLPPDNQSLESWLREERAKGFEVYVSVLYPSFGLVGVVTLDHRDVGEIRCWDLVIAPELQGQGHGRRLVARLQAAADSFRCALVLDAVPEAFPFYRNLGFDVVVSSHVSHTPERCLCEPHTRFAHSPPRTPLPRTRFARARLPRALAYPSPTPRLPAPIPRAYPAPTPRLPRAYPAPTPRRAPTPRLPLANTTVRPVRLDTTRLDM